MPAKTSKTTKVKKRGVNKISQKTKRKKALTKKIHPAALPKKTSFLLKDIFALLKSPKNPIIEPQADLVWESHQTFNPAAFYFDNKVHLLYRAIGSDGISRIGYAGSLNGFTINERLSYPAYQHLIRHGRVFIDNYFSGGSWGGCEDPRLVRIDNEDRLFMTYTACDGGLRVALTSIKLQDFLNKVWNWTPAVPISAPGEVHKNWVIFPEKIKGQYAILHSLSPKIQITYRKNLDFDGQTFIKSEYKNGGRKKDWDSWVRGAGPPPLKTKDGWLLLYHAMDQRDPGKYKVGAMLLDLKNPEKILYRCREPILEPLENYENNGFKAGVVYAAGAIIKRGKLIVYYGGADNYVCVASTSLNKFLKELKTTQKPKVKKIKKIKRIKKL